MPLALVKVHFHSIKDEKYGDLNYISDLNITNIENNLSINTKAHKFPSIFQSQHERTNTNVDKTTISANRLIAGLNQKISEILSHSSLIYVSTKVEKELLSDFIDGIPIHVLTSNNKQ